MSAHPYIFGRPRSLQGVVSRHAAIARSSNQSVSCPRQTSARLYLDQFRTLYRNVKSALPISYISTPATDISATTPFAGEIVQNLQEEGLDLVQYGRGFLSLAAPTAELERLSVSRALWHGGHPVLRWNASNGAVRQDPAGNIKPDKERSSYARSLPWPFRCRYSTRRYYSCVTSTSLPGRGSSSRCCSRLGSSARSDS